MAGLAVLLIILGCAAYLYLKGTLIKAFLAVIIAICASVVAFNYFEALANVLISRSVDSRFSALAPWAQALSFVLLFVLVFAILQTIASQLTREPVTFTDLPERIGRVICGMVLGMMLSGILLTALAMAPLPNKYPYQRFDPTDPNPEKPNKVLLNADGFATGWFNIISRGSFSGKQSFTIIHPDFLDQHFLNRHSIGEKIPIFAQPEAIQVQRKNAVWFAPEELDLKRADDPNVSVEPKSGYNLIFVQVGIKQERKKATTFTPSQIRLVCKRKTDQRDLITGKARNIYPIAYLRTADQLDFKKLNEQIILQAADFEHGVKWIDLAFYMPINSVPVLLEFKQNNIVRLPSVVSAEQAPPAQPFLKPPEPARDANEPTKDANEPASDKVD